MDLFTASSHNDYDVIIITETWFHQGILSTEIFDSLIYNVFRLDRCKSVEERGGGVLVAVRTTFSCKQIQLPILDVEQICVSVNVEGTGKSIFFIVTYIPPKSKVDTYETCIENIEFVNSHCSDLSNICVLGDFNIGDVVWSWSEDDKMLIPHNVIKDFELAIIDLLLCCNLCQINSITNSQNRI